MQRQLLVACAWGPSALIKLYPAQAHEENERRRLCLWPGVTSGQVFAGIAKGDDETPLREM